MGNSLSGSCLGNIFSRKRQNKVVPVIPDLENDSAAAEVELLKPTSGEIRITSSSKGDAWTTVTVEEPEVPVEDTSSGVMATKTIIMRPACNPDDQIVVVDLEVESDGQDDEMREDIKEEEEEEEEERKKDQPEAGLGQDHDTSEAEQHATDEEGLQDEGEREMVVEPEEETVNEVKDEGQEEEKEEEKDELGSLVDEGDDRFLQEATSPVAGLGDRPESVVSCRLQGSVESVDNVSLSSTSSIMCDVEYESDYEAYSSSENDDDQDGAIAADDGEDDFMGSDTNVVDDDGDDKDDDAHAGIRKWIADVEEELEQDDEVVDTEREEGEWKMGLQAFGRTWNDLVDEIGYVVDTENAAKNQNHLRYAIRTSWMRKMGWDTSLVPEIHDDE